MNLDRRSRMRNFIDAKVLVAAVIAAGCGAASQSDGAPDAAPPTPAPSEPAASPPATSEPANEAPKPTEIHADRKDPEGGSLRQRLMKSHFNQTAAIREAVISGKIGKAVRPADALTDMEGVETLPKQWQVSVKQLQGASKRIREGSNIQEVAAATADIGRACATCHAAVSGPKIKVGDPPAQSDKMADRMKRHMWATERLWEGIYGPSDAAWKAGAAALEMDSFPKQTIAKGGVHAHSSAARFSKLSKSAANNKTGEQRAKLYSQLLTTCAPCHEAMGVTGD